MVRARTPGTEQILQRVYKKKRKCRFLKRVGGVPTGAGLVDGGVDQGPWFQGRVGGSWKGQGTCVVFLLFLTRTKRRKMAFFEVAGEVGAGWQFQRNGLLAVPKRQVQGRVGLVGSSTGGGKGSGGIQGLRFRGGRCVIFHRGGVPGEGWRVDLVTCSRRGLPRAVWCRSH